MEKSKPKLILGGGTVSVYLSGLCYIAMGLSFPLESQFVALIVGMAISSFL